MNMHGLPTPVLPTMTNKHLPLRCERIDHYTIIVPEAKAVSDFHHDVLGYNFLELKEVNAGSAPAGQVDMLNYIHEWPDASGRVMVITEGLTDTSIFRRFMSKYGPGIHHIALQVDDLELAFATLKQAGIKTTSDRIMKDVISGLKQIFVDNAETGVFIELIERCDDAGMAVDATEKGFFTHDNMAGLAGTMSGYIDDVKKVKAIELGSASGTARQKIRAVKLQEFVLEVDDPQRSAEFFESTFGFRRAADAPENTVRMYLESEPELSFLCVAKSAEMRLHRLDCEAMLDRCESAQIMSGHAHIAVSDNQLQIGPVLTGYPISINCAAEH